MTSIVRRVQFTGKSTYIISIPKDWARSIGISKGSKVFVEITPDNSLKIRPEPKLSEVRLAKVLDLSAGLDVNTAMREIVSAYLAGFEIFKVNSNSRTAEAMKKLRNLIDAKLANIIVIDEDGKNVTYKVVGSPKPLTIRDATAWLSRLVNNMFSDLLKGMSSGDLGALEVVRERDDIVDKAYIMVTRQLVRVLMGEVTLEAVGLSSQAEAIHYYHAFKILERIADHLSSISMETMKLVKNNSRVDTSIVKFLEEVALTMKTISEALVKLAVETSRTSALQVEVLKTKLGELSMSISSIENNIVRNNIIMSIGRILSYSLDLAEVVFDINAIKNVAETIYE